MNYKKFQFYISFFVLTIGAILIQSCSTTKYVPEGEYLLSSTVVRSDKKVIPAMEMESYIKQKPNFKTFALFKLPLFIYNLSGEDTTKWINRTLRNAGDPPVIYDSTMLDQTVVDLRRMMTNKGYLNATVTPLVKLEDKKADVIYDIRAGEPYRIENYNIEIADNVVEENKLPVYSRRAMRRGLGTSYVSLDSVLSYNSLVKENAIFDLDVLDLERDRIASIFRRSGYYGFNKEYIGFDADTTLGNNGVGLDLAVYPFLIRTPGGEISELPHQQYIIKDIEFRVDHNPLQDSDTVVPTSIYEKDGYIIKYGPRGRYIRPNVILDNCYIVPGTLFNENRTTLTYTALSQLQILRNVNISYVEVIDNDSTKLRCIITCVPDKKQGISAEIEGTNSGGYFGVGAGVGYLHRNAFRGSELFNVRLRGAYEAITPNFSSFADNYFEIGGETSLTFPNFMFPFVKKDFRRRIHASTQFNASYTFQRRPGFFTRTVLGSGVKYIWQSRGQSLNRHVFDLIDISYVHLPTNSLDSAFYSRLSDAARQYSFRDHFIVSTGYTFSRTNVRNTAQRMNQPIYSLRASIETAGNLLALAAKLGGSKTDSYGSKQIFGTNYSQYVRATADYSKTYYVDDKNSFAWHVGGGIALPYGNSQQIPIQKRFFSGGANSVRGWSIRDLGPGSYYYDGDDEAGDNFYYHSGDIRLDASIEYRSKLFWIFELGAFIDAGNIWTIRNYEEQPNGVFKLDKFYKEIAVAWGLGIRLDFDFVLVRLDCGWKAYDPSGNPNTSKWPIKEPFKLKKNTALHIAVGYPF